MPRRLLPLLALLALAAGCGSSGAATSSGAAPPQDVSLQLDWYPNPDHVGLYTAIDRGFFRRAGLDVTPRQPTDVSDPIKLVAAGRADLGISYEPELFFAQQQHAPVVAVAAIVPTALNSIITTEQGITTPAGLRGKTIGVDGSASTNAYVDTVLRTAGLAPGDVHLVTVGFNLLPALLAGRVDAIAGGFQNIEGAELAARGLHPVVFPVDRYGVPGYDELVVVANGERLAERRRLSPRRARVRLGAGRRHRLREGPSRDGAGRDARQLVPRLQERAGDVGAGDAEAAGHDIAGSRCLEPVRPLDAGAGPAQEPARRRRAGGEALDGSSTSSASLAAAIGLG